MHYGSMGLPSMQTTIKAPSTDFTATTETVGEARSSDSTPLSEEASEAAGPTPPSDGTGTTASDDYSSTPEDVSSWRSAGITTGITTPSDETGDTLPPWTPEPSFETPTGRPLRKSSRRGDPDIHTVLNNILSIIGGNVRVRGQPAPSLQPPASGSNRINNRGPPQFVAGTGPGPLPPPRPLVGGLPPTQWWIGCQSDSIELTFSDSGGYKGSQFSSAGAGYHFDGQRYNQHLTNPD
ncbi:hypothetical protein FJT64_011351 [Amphibalanus amphitrite]|uniref:Uncharacterized protein n=1 Tax=Amphibalanus amphitrite TaxID=1232801 RepID=A0A6A4V9K2_AMPAM|nr:hypothetical protein FJT64_011351 [Amphibalanus amphitrite]